MRYIVLTVRDRAADVFGQPIFVAAVGQAVRGFTDQVNDAKAGPLFLHPEDFDLYELGTFDDATGQFQNLEKPRQVAIGKDVKVRS